MAECNSSSGLCVCVCVSFKKVSRVDPSEAVMHQPAAWKEKLAQI